MLNDHFVNKMFFQEVVKENRKLPVQQLYETQRAESNTEIALPDFINVKIKLREYERRIVAQLTQVFLKS